MRIAFILPVLFVFTNAISQQSIGYFLPKKIIYVSVPFTITERKLFRVDPATGQPENNPIKFVTTVRVDGDVKVESKMYAQMYKNLNLEPLGSGGKSFNFDIGFDEKGAGFLSTVNASQTPVTSDIIKGTVNIVASVLKLVVGFFAFKDGDKIATTEQITEQKIVETRAIELSNNQPISLTITPNIIANQTVAKPSASVVVTVSSGSSVGPNPAVNAIAKNNSGILLYYRIPAEHTIKVKVVDNQLVKEHIVIEEKLLMPQTGIETALNIPILKRKRTVDIAFDPATGNLTKYGIKKESQVGDNLGSVSNGIGSLTTEINTLKNTIKENNDKDVEKKKQDEQESRNKDIKDEIERLKLEKDKLDLIIARQNLLDEIDAKKQTQEEAKKTKKN